MLDSLPSVFARYASQVQFVQKHGPNRWSSTCPKCGGEKHLSGALPDRCIWTPVGKNGKASGYCFQCKTTFWPDSDDDANLDPTERRLRALEREQARQAAEQQAMADRLARVELYEAERQKYEQGRLWEQYHDQRGEVGKRYWEQRGLNDFWQDYYQLGYWPNSQWHAATATIPIFGKDYHPVNMKHRLIGVEQGKYRYHIQNGGTPLFLCNPEADIAGHVYAIEGEIKAAVTYSRLEDANAVIVGLPGVAASEETIAPLKQADRVTLVVDPGAHEQGIELARKIGISKCYMLEPADKIDDGLLAGDIRGNDVKRILSTATRLSAFVTGR